MYVRVPMRGCIQYTCECVPVRTYMVAHAWVFVCTSLSVCLSVGVYVLAHTFVGVCLYILAFPKNIIYMYLMLYKQLSLKVYKMHSMLP